MLCDFEGLIIIEEPIPVGNEDDLQRVLDEAGVSGEPTEIHLTDNIVLTGSLTVPIGARIVITRDADQPRTIDGGNHDFRLINIETDETHEKNTILHIDGVNLIHGQTQSPEGNGGAICAETPGIAQIVIKGASDINNNHGKNGGAIWIFEGAVEIAGSANLNNNIAEGYGGAIYAPCVRLTSGQITQNQAGLGGGGIYAKNFEMMSGHIDHNTTPGTGGGVMLIENGEINITDNSSVFDHNKANEGGAIYKAKSTTPSTSGTINITGGITFDSNEAPDGGGAIWIDYSELKYLKIDADGSFFNNVATIGISTRNPWDDAIYEANIFAEVWTNPYDQGYNNKDISYDGEGPEPPVPPEPGEKCKVSGQQMIDMCLPVSVRPFVNVGTITTSCCGEAIITPGITGCLGEPIGNCDFTIQQRVCVEVPVEFGAVVDAMDPHAACTGEDCASCERS